MLKQILTTSSLIIVAAVSIQSASAADAGRSRRILVEPAGKTSILAGSKFQGLIATPSSGIASPSDTPVVATGGGNTQIKQLIVSPQGGTPSPSSDPVVVVDNGNNNGRNNNDRPIRTNNQQIVVSPKPVFTADANAGRQNFATPVVAAPVVATADAAFTQDQDPAPVVAAADTTVADAPAPADETADAAPATDDSNAAAVDTAASDATPAADETDATVEHSPKHLYGLLTGRGYDVKVLKRDDYGNYLFRATNDQGGYLLLVDGYDGKVLYRKPIEAAAYTYAPAAHHYPVVSYNTENCNY